VNRFTKLNDKLEALPDDTTSHIAVAEQATIVASHSLTDAMRHKPCGLVGHVQHAVNLVAAHALFAGAE
jgi:hypothetical protein